ncbi:hypothetical protein B0J18DRAFT_409184 [Chaetomium sp. MPI-SDFR-AT-0129]|nr:hypothetical protein B0J18DRAFT_409184 [Chaetomium sp. MPI-SDFR-AT-0129]
MRRPRLKRSPSSKYTTPEHMMPIMLSPSRESFRERNTGFPDAFCGTRNTSRPHPEANFGPDACLTEDDINPARALHRYRESFMARQAASRASTIEENSPNPPEESTFATIRQMAINSIMPSRDGDSEESSDGLSSQDPESPRHRGTEFDRPPTAKVDPRESEAQDPRKGRRRRRSSFLGRFMHR